MAEEPEFTDEAELALRAEQGDQAQEVLPSDHALVYRGTCVQSVELDAVGDREGEAVEIREEHDRPSCDLDDVVAV
jgi:hypothetical protein